MMEKAIKQRLLGGLVLVAGAALFLPVLLDGSGAALTIPPMPAAPEVAGVEGMAPRLDQKVAEAGAEVAAAHEGRDAGPADAVAPPEGEASEVAPDAAALAAGSGGAAASAAAGPVAPAAPAAAARPVPVAGAAPASPSAAPVSAPARPAAAPVASAAPVPAKAEARPEPKAVTKPAEPRTPEPKVPEPRADKPAGGAWMVQVARVSSREKAQDLMRKLRARGYPAVLSQQGDSWKVMVGPELSREVANSTKNRLNADAAIGVSDAWVQAYKP